jgi:hypothetical protein
LDPSQLTLESGHALLEDGAILVRFIERRPQSLHRRGREIDLQRRLDLLQIAEEGIIGIARRRRGGLHLLEIPAHRFPPLRQRRLDIRVLDLLHFLLPGFDVVLRVLAHGRGALARVLVRRLDVADFLHVILVRLRQIGGRGELIHRR